MYHGLAKILYFAFPVDDTRSNSVLGSKYLMEGLIFNVSRYGKTISKLYFAYPIDDTRPIPIPGLR